ncbi:ARM repeat-containing protein [Polyplosphaeria fusca]|uniref:ARM repeat-containing protein n=1 Tax=Polyplosphaeria fusca TaxID=682080 RepID=A0A9P4QQG7_9PLEO|nr:ARM repeat-containing protein [Polyplosphaeria fusca]
MPYFSELPEELLSSLELYLRQSPKSDCGELDEIPEILTRLVQKRDAKEAESVAQVLGTAVGQQKYWQLPFKQSGILAHCLSHLDLSESPAGLIRQYLRVIGNCVADNDINRAVATDHLSALIKCLDLESLAVTALAVMFNLCNDYDAAQIEASALRLDTIVASHLMANKIPDEAVDYAADLLTWTTEKLSPAQLKAAESISTFKNILELSLQYDEDHYQDYVAICAHYLQDMEFQQQILSPETLERLINLLFDFEERLLPEEIQSVFEALAIQSGPANPSTDDPNVILLVQLVTSLSAMSATDSFVQDLDIQSSVVEKIRAKISSAEPELSPFIVFACVALGNLATTDQVSINMVENMELHLPLLKILALHQEPALLYAAAGFMRHLTFPEQNRDVLGKAGLIETCCELLAQEDPTVRGEAAAILCKLVSNNLHNISKVVQDSVQESIVLPEVQDINTAPKATVLYYLVTMALVPSKPLPSTSMKNPMLELGRTIIAVFRFLSHNKRNEDVQALIRDAIMTPLVARPVARLVRQRFFADARSEGILGLGLMAQSPEGAACVVEELKADEGLLEAVKEFVSEQKKDGEQSGPTAGRDLQNAIVLLHGLAANGGGALGPGLKKEVENLQASLSRLAL